MWSIHRVLVQDILTFIRLTDGYRLDPDVQGENAFLLRGVQAYYQQQGLNVHHDLNKMVFELNPQYPGGFVPKGKTDVLMHIQSAFLFFEMTMVDGTGNEGVRNGASCRFAWLCCAFRIVLFGLCVRHNRFCLRV